MVSDDELKKKILSRVMQEPQTYSSLAYYTFSAYGFDAMLKVSDILYDFIAQGKIKVTELNYLGHGHRLVFTRPDYDINKLCSFSHLKWKKTLSKVKSKGEKNDKGKKHNRKSSGKQGKSQN